jgi:hypothetical protein
MDNAFCFLHIEEFWYLFSKHHIVKNTPLFKCWKIFRAQQWEILTKIACSINVSPEEKYNFSGTLKWKFIHFGLSFHKFAWNSYHFHLILGNLFCIKSKVKLYINPYLRNIENGSKFNMKNNFEFHSLKNKNQYKFSVTGI